MSARLVIRTAVAVVLLLSAGILHGAGDNQLEEALVRVKWHSVRDFVASQPRIADRTANVFSGYSSLIAGEYRAAAISFRRADSARASDTTLQTEIDALASRYPDSAICLVLKADAMARAGQLLDADATASQAMRIDSKLDIAYHVRGTIRALLGQDAAAIKDIDRANQLNPNLADAYVVRGILALREGNVGRAQAEFEKALSLAPDFAVAANGRGVTLCLQERYSEAIQAFRLALDLEPSLRAAEINARLARELASPARMKDRIEILSGKRAGALGCRLLVPVIASQDRQEAATNAARAAVIMATGIDPEIVSDFDGALGALEAQRPVILNCVPGGPDDAADLAGLLAKVGLVRDAQAMPISDGQEGAEFAVAVFKKFFDEVHSSPPAVKGWCAIDPAQGPDSSNGFGLLLAQAAGFRARGLDIHAYAAADDTSIEYWKSIPPERAAVLPVTWLPPAQRLHAGCLADLVPLELASGWVSSSYGMAPDGSRVYLQTAGGGNMLYLPDLSHPDFGPSGPSVPGENGIIIGTSRIGGNPQILIGDNLLIRLDIDNPHNQDCHVNVQHGDTNIHTDKDFKIAKDDSVTVKVSGDKVTVLVNGNVAKEYPLPSPATDGEIVIERSPRGVTKISRDGKTVGTVTVNQGGNVVVAAGDKRIEVPSHEQSPQDGSNDERAESRDSSGGQSDSGMSHEEELDIVEQWEAELEWLCAHGLGGTERAKQLENRIKEWNRQRGPKPPPGGPKGEGEGGKEPGGKEGGPGNNKDAAKAPNGKNTLPAAANPAIIIVGPGGVTVIPGPLDGPFPPEWPPFPPRGDLPPYPPRGPIDVWPPEPPIIPFFKADSADSAPHRVAGQGIEPGRASGGTAGAQRRNGVYTVDESNLEVIAPDEADVDVLFGGRERTKRDPLAELQCPCLIFGAMRPEGKR